MNLILQKEYPLLYDMLKRNALVRSSDPDDRDSLLHACGFSTLTDKLQLGKPADAFTANLITKLEKIKGGGRHFHLARHAALPLILTPELANLIRVNFPARGQGPIPWIAEADLLLSPLCRPMDDGLYELEPRIREVLLEGLEGEFGRERAVEIAEFLMAWLDRRPDRHRRPDATRSYRWIVRAYRRPAEAADEMERWGAACRTPEDGAGVRRGDQLLLANLAEVIARPMLRAGEVGERFGVLLGRTRELAAELHGAREGRKKQRPEDQMRMEGRLPPPKAEFRATSPLQVAIGDSGVRMTFVYIPPGEFMMGSPKDEPGRWDDEVQHHVTLTQGFYMQTTPVTQGQWEAVMGDNPSSFKEDGPECPVETVSWEDAQAFIERLNRAEGDDVYRLPTEAEWEYACRAGTTTPFYTGRCLGTDEANYDGDYPLEGCPKGVYREKTTPVGSFPSNPFGLYDMHGNVWEWCRDWHGPYPSEPIVDPTGPDTGSVRVRRGGGWFNYGRHCRSAGRSAFAPADRIRGGGFRLVRRPGQRARRMPAR